MLTRSGIAVLIALSAPSGCRSRAPESSPVTKPSPPSPQPPGSSRVDDLFRSYEHKLPEPETLSEQNGASFECAHHGWVTYTLLYATSKKLPLESDAELVQLVPWARHPDTCLRYIAIQAIIARIGFDSNRTSLPGMHEPEHYHFHDIFVALKAYFDAKKIAVYPQVFAEMKINITANDFAMMKGRWDEEPTPSKNFLTTVEFDGELLRVTTRRVQPSPTWPDHTWTTKLKDVTVNDQKQFVITGEWNVESNTKGYQGAKVTPSQFTYSVWPVRADLVWFRDGSYWTKLRRN